MNDLQVGLFWDRWWSSCPAHGLFISSGYVAIEYGVINESIFGGMKPDVCRHCDCRVWTAPMAGAEANPVTIAERLAASGEARTLFSTLHSSSSTSSVPPTLLPHGPLLLIVEHGGDDLGPSR